MRHRRDLPPLLGRADAQHVPDEEEAVDLEVVAAEVEAQEGLALLDPLLGDDADLVVLQVQVVQVQVLQGG